MSVLNEIKKILGKAGISKRDIISHLAIDNPVIFEAGANNGDDTVDWAKKLPNAQIYCFEPIPRLFEVLQDRLSGFNNVQCFPLGFSNSAGKVEMYISARDGDESSNPSSSSILKPDQHVEFHPRISFDQRIEIEVDTIDQWAKRQGVDRIDLMWLDMQGAEHLALQGAEEMLSRVKLIYSEVSFKQMFEGTPLFDEYTGILNSFGFNLIAVDRRWKDMGNALYQRR
ncbi:FkbM family methyltransferase [Marinoscillum sp. MHG1-6]|uniref:FkbM family methyltransferase n=1 Tax=Marinoscillum sp. MHG1-6 TaxID=2959627 RepID=UPI0021573A81|nr:FkbM family methyltransferase [Marinoscillum sp. MHG1-6]